MGRRLSSVPSSGDNPSSTRTRLSSGTLQQEVGVGCQELPLLMFPALLDPTVLLCAVGGSDDDSTYYLTP